MQLPPNQFSSMFKQTPTMSTRRERFKHSVESVYGTRDACDLHWENVESEIFCNGHVSDGHVHEAIPAPKPARPD